MPCREKPDCKTWHIAPTPQLCEDVCETAGVPQRRGEPSPPADWGKNHKNIFHMQAAVNKPVKYLQACQGICNGDHSVAFECKSFCLGRQSSKVDAPGLLFSLRVEPAIWLCWQRDLCPGRNRFLLQKQTPSQNTTATQFAMTSAAPPHSLPH